MLNEGPHLSELRLCSKESQRVAPLRRRWSSRLVSLQGKGGGRGAADRVVVVVVMVMVMVVLVTMVGVVMVVVMSGRGKKHQGQVH